MTGFGLMIAAFILVVWGKDWVADAIAAYDRRTDAIRALQHQGEAERG